MENNQQEIRKPFLINRKKSLVTYILIGICVAIFILDFLVQVYFAATYDINWSIINEYGMKINSAIAKGQLWRYVTAMFLHGNLMHIGFNMYALFIWGRHIEVLYGRWRFLVIYFMAGILSIAASFAFTSANSLGASGAIYGLFGALFYFRKYDKQLFNKIFGTQVFLFVGVSLFLGFTMTYVDNVAHIAGLAGGYLAAQSVGLLSQIIEKKRTGALYLAIYSVILIGFTLIGMFR